jgi:cysteine desulfurase/selenocysteine lyase
MNNDQVKNIISIHQTPESIDIDKIRADFPILARQFEAEAGGPRRPLVYLDNAATSQKPRAVIAAIVGYYETMNANIHRSLHRLGEEATAAYEQSRQTVARFIGAASPTEIIFTAGTTAAINLVASAWGRHSIHRGDEILLTEMEHHSNLIPWQILARERGAKLKFIPVQPDGTLDYNEIPRLLTRTTKFVALTHMSNVFGTINAVARIIHLAHEQGALVLLDAAQSVPHLAVNVTELDCDFLAFSGHKIGGPTGIGVLYGKKRFLEAMEPYQGGGEMIRTVTLTEATWNDLPYKFEAGTPPIAGAIGLCAAIDYLNTLGMPAIERHIRQLTESALARLGQIHGLTWFGDPDIRRGGLLSFALDRIHPHDLAQFLDSQGIAVRAGHHCAQPLMRKLGVSGTTRISFGVYNTVAEIETLAATLQQAKEFFHHGTE